MKKILLLCEALNNRAGIERMTVELANLLCRSYDVLIVTIEQFSYESCPYKIDCKVKVESLNSQFFKRIYSLNYKNIKALRKILNEENPTVLIAVATPMVRIAVPAALGLHIKTIGWEHFNIFAGSKIGAIYKVISTWMADQTVVLTEKDAFDFKKMYAKRIEVIPNFTSIGVNPPSQCGEKVILAVGRHEPQKGFDMLIKAWSKVIAPGWKLRIIGDGSKKDENKQLALDLGVTETIEFKDATPMIAEEFQRASCFVLSSRFEGLVLVLIEAKMMGLPCISFNCPNSPREVIMDGRDGWLVENGNIDALVNKLTSVLCDMEKLRQAGKNARKDAIARYSPEAIKKKWIKLIES